MRQKPTPHNFKKPINKNVLKKLIKTYYWQLKQSNLENNLTKIGTLWDYLIKKTIKFYKKIPIIYFTMFVIVN